MMMAAVANLLPPTVGDQIEVSTHDPELRGWVEWHGFTVVSADALAYRMRRNALLGMRYLDSSLTVISEPRCPSNADKFIRVVS
jgi:hypothetical protein